MRIEPYLFFHGRCAEAIAFYESALGAKVEMLMRFRDNPRPPPDTMTPEMADRVMHAHLVIGGATLMLSDGYPTEEPKFQGFAVSLSVASVAEADKAFAALGEGGETRMPLGATVFSPRFGMVVDRFGVLWIVIAQA